MDQLFNNASVAAFIGAALSGIVAVVTVAITDRLRDRRMVKTIRNEVAIAREHAVGKLETVRAMRDAMHRARQVRPGEVLKFDVAVIREMKGRILHLLNPRQRQALDAVLFRMEGVDALLDDAHQLQDALRPPAKAPEGTTARLSGSLGDVVVNLKMFIEMADRYAAGDFAAITQKRYSLGDYAEPPTPAHG